MTDSLTSLIRSGMPKRQARTLLNDSGFIGRPRRKLRVGVIGIDFHTLGGDGTTTDSSGGDQYYYEYISDLLDPQGNMASPADVDAVFAQTSNQYGFQLRDGLYSIEYGVQYMFTPGAGAPDWMYWNSVNFEPWFAPNGVMVPYKTGLSGGQHNFQLWWSKALFYLENDSESTTYLEFPTGGECISVQGSVVVTQWSEGL